MDCEDDVDVLIEDSEESPKEHAERQKDQKVITMLKEALQEKARCISDLTYLVEDASVLQNALNSLENVMKAMDAACMKQEGLPVCLSPRKRKLNAKTVDYHKVFHSKLPLRKQFKKSKAKKAPKVAVGIIDLTEADDFEPPVMHRRPGECDVSSVSTLQKQDKNTGIMNSKNSFINEFK